MIAHFNDFIWIEYYFALPIPEQIFTCVVSMGFTIAVTYFRWIAGKCKYYSVRCRRVHTFALHAFFFSKIVNHTNIGNLFIELVSFFAHSVCCFHQRLQFDFVFTASSTFNNNISCWRIEKWGNKEQWTLIWLRTVKPVNTDPRIQRKSCEWKKTRFHPPHSIESF